MKIEIFVQYTREKHSHMVKVSQLTPDSFHSLKEQLRAKFHQDWTYFGFGNVQSSKPYFQWEIGRVSSFWELEKDTPPHTNLYDILSRIKLGDLHSLDIADLAMLEDERPVSREFIIAYLQKRVAASPSKLTDLFRDSPAGTFDTDSTDAGSASLSTPASSPVLPRAVHVDACEPADILGPSLKRKRDGTPEVDTVLGFTSSFKRLKVSEGPHDFSGHSSGDYPPDDGPSEHSSPVRSRRPKFPIEAVEEIARLTARAEQAEKEASDIKAEYSQWVTEEKNRFRTSWSKCKEQRDGYKACALEHQQRAQHLQKEKDDLEAAFEEERGSHLKEVEELRKQLAEKSAPVAVSPDQLTIAELAPAIADLRTQIARYKNHNAQLQRDLQEERDKSRVLPKELESLRESLARALHAAGEADRARQVAEARLQHELDTVTRLRGEQNKRKLAGDDAKEVKETHNKAVKAGQAVMVELYEQNVDLARRLEKCENELTKKNKLLKEKLHLVRTSGDQLQHEMAKSDRLQKEVERLETAQRARISHDGNRDDWKRRHGDAVAKCTELEVDMTRAARERAEENIRLVTKISDLEARLAAGASTEHDGALASIANRPGQTKKGKRISQRDQQAQLFTEKEEQIAKLEQEAKDIRLELDESRSEYSSLQWQREEDAKAMETEKAARAQAEKELGMERRALEHFKDTFKSIGSASPLIVPAFAEAMRSLGELTDKALK